MCGGEPHGIADILCLTDLDYQQHDKDERKERKKSKKKLNMTSLVFFNNDMEIEIGKVIYSS